VQKLVVANGTAQLDLDIARLNGAEISSDANLATVRFALAPNSFFTIVVSNDLLRTPLPGAISFIPQNSADLPAALAASLHQFVLEKKQSGETFDLVLRDSTNQIVFFNIEGQSYDYDANRHSFNIQNARLLVSQEFAAALSQPSIAGSIVGTVSLEATMQPVEITRFVNGEATQDIMPAVGTVPGPDVIVGDLTTMSQEDTASVGGQVGISVGTDSCNAGTIDLNWFANPANDHPVIPQNLYRMSGGATNNERFEQIGQSSVKHAFTALTENICGWL